MKIKSKNKFFGNVLIAVGVLCVLYFLWINYSGRMFQFVYALTYNEADADNSDFFSYDDIPDVLLSGQELLGAEQEPAVEIPPEEIIPAPEPIAPTKNVPEGNKNIDYTRRIDYNNGDINLIVPRLGVKSKVAGATDTKSLKKAPGLYDISDLPTKENGRVLIAAHRDIYGAWFYNIDKMRKGDKIKIQFQNKTYIYDYVETTIVERTDWSVTEPRGFSAVVLTSCTPKGTSEKRIAVVGKLVDIIEN